MRIHSFNEDLYELGSGAIKVVMKDTAGSDVIPNEAYMHITRLDGYPVVSNRELTDLNSTMYLTMTGTDLTVYHDEVGFANRLVVFYGTYDDQNLGDDIPFKRVYKIRIQAIDVVAHDLNISVFDTALGIESIGVTV